METSPATPLPTGQCAACNAEVLADDAFCTGCGYPVKGTEQEQRYFLSKREAANIDINSFNKRLSRAGNSLYYLAAIFVIFGLIYYFTKESDQNAFAVLITNLILAAVFLALGGYSRKKPLACIVSGLSLYVILIILNAVTNPASLVSGIIFKIIIIGYMINGIKSAIEIEKLKKEHNIA